MKYFPMTFLQENGKFFSAVTKSVLLFLRLFNEASSTAWGIWSQMKGNKCKTVNCVIGGFRDVFYIINSEFAWREWERISNGLRIETATYQIQSMKHDLNYSVCVRACVRACAHARMCNLSSNILPTWKSYHENISFSCCSDFAVKNAHADCCFCVVNGVFVGEYLSFCERNC